MFITSAPAVIGILYDDRYFPAAQFLSILLVAGIINFVIDTETDMMVAIDRVRWQLYVNIIRLLVYALSSFTLYKVFGVIGVVWTIAFTAIVMKAVTSSVMWYLGIARIKEEMKFFLVAIMGAAVGMSITVSGKAFWSSMPLPFFSS